MSKQIDALKLALEALEKVTKEMLALKDELAERGGRPTTDSYRQKLWDSAFDAYTGHALPAATAIKEALAVDKESLTTEAQQSNEQGCEHCNHSLYCGTKCKNCGKQSNEQVELDDFELLPVDPAIEMKNAAINVELFDHDTGKDYLLSWEEVEQIYSAMLNAAPSHPPVPTAQPKDPKQEPLFWYRPCRDGLYEGPEHHKSVGGKMLRDEKPEEWKPLYTTPPQRKECEKCSRNSD